MPYPEFRHAPATLCLLWFAEIIAAPNPALCDCEFSVRLASALGGRRAVSGEVGAEGARYWAFISYSHKDAAFGRRLHRRLENYRLPSRLVRRATSSTSVVPQRIVPVFRDREELPAAHDLSAEVHAALKASRSLIVVCSPAAAASAWVSREVDVFRALHPTRPILAAVHAGEPTECMPVNLRHIGEGGQIIEPLAADFRKGRDGDQLALLKLVAGVVGLPLDELVQRDSHRRVQRVTAVTVLALTAMLAMGALTVFAINARAEADRQRGEAEGLVEYMLTDLRDRLKGVGRLDVMTAVNERALKYYSDQDITHLPVDSLERRARILHAMGEDDETRGDDKAAIIKFREAERTTSTLLAQAPNDPERIYDEAQSEFWVGSVDYRRKQFASAARHFLQYKHLSSALVATDPHNSLYLQEAGYADGNLCVLALEDNRHPTKAISPCTTSLREFQEAARNLKQQSRIVDDLINAHAWLADAFRYSGDLTHAKSERQAEERILDTQMASDPRNMDLKETWVETQRALAILDKQAGDVSSSRDKLMRDLKVVEEMIRFEPKNKRWNNDKTLISSTLASLEKHN